jgi:5-methylthioadenosine/S-adenosylhomocysteine deaminase
MEVSSQIAQYSDLLLSSGLRLVLAEQVSDRPAGTMVGEPDSISFDTSRGAEGLRRIEELHAICHGAAGGRISVAAAAHAPDMVSPDLFRRLSALQERLNLIATVHLNQYWGEVEAIGKTFGMLPTEHLARLGYLNDRLIASHCRCMTPAEEEMLGKASVTVCYTPAVTARCGNSARIGVLEDAGARIVLGSDEMAEDMVEVLRLSILLERVRRRDSQSPTPKDAWSWGSSNGYQALGISDGGSIRPGFLADLIMIDCIKPHLIPTIRVASGFIHQGQASDIESVMVDGRWIMRDRAVLTIDENNLLERAEEVARSAWKRMLGEFPDMRRPGDLDLTLRPLK